MLNGINIIFHPSQLNVEACGCLQDIPYVKRVTPDQSNLTQSAESGPSVRLKLRGAESMPTSTPSAKWSTDRPNFENSLIY